MDRIFSLQTTHQNYNKCLRLKFQKNPLTFNLGTEADLPLTLLRLNILARSRSLLVHLPSCRDTRPIWGASSRNRIPSRMQLPSSSTPATVLPQFRIPSALTSLVIDRSSEDLEKALESDRCLFRSITKDEALVRRARSICGTIRLAINCSVFVANSCDLPDRDSIFERYLIAWTLSVTWFDEGDTLPSKGEFSTQMCSLVFFVASSLWFLEESSAGIVCSPVPGAETLLLKTRLRASILEDAWIERVNVSRYCGFTTVLCPSSSTVFLPSIISRVSDVVP